MDWRGRFAGTLLGAAGGMSINVLSNDVGYRGAAVVAVAGGVLTAASWLRRLPPRAPLVRYTVRVLLVLSLAGAVISGVGPEDWSAPIIITIVALTTVAASAYSDLKTIRTLLFGVALVGLGAIFMGSGFSLVISDIRFFGVSYIVAGVAVISLGIATLLGAGIGRPVAGISTAVAVIILGAAKLTHYQQLSGLLFISLGVIALGPGIAILSKVQVVRAISYIVGGSWGTLTGVTVLVVGFPVSAGITCITAGIAVIGLGIATLFDWNGLRTLTFIVLGMASIFYGYICLVENSLPYAVIYGGVGVAAVLGRTDRGKRLQLWLASLTKDPAHNREG